MSDIRASIKDDVSTKVWGNVLNPICLLLKDNVLQRSEVYSNVASRVNDNVRLNINNIMVMYIRKKKDI